MGHTPQQSLDGCVGGYVLGSFQESIGALQATWVAEGSVFESLGALDGVSRVSRLACLPHG